MNELIRRRRALMMQAKEESDAGWKDDVAYENVNIINNSYYTKSGVIRPYNGWSRTDYLPCKGASSITIPKVAPVTTGSNPDWNVFVDDNYKFIKTFSASYTQAVNITVPTNAAFFGMSFTTAALENIINAGIVPHA